MNAARRLHAARNVASVVSYAFLTPEVSLYREEAEQAGEAHPVYVADKLIDIVLNDWRRSMADPVGEIVGNILAGDATEARETHAMGAIYADVAAALKSAFQAMSRADIRHMRPEDWHVMTALCKAGRLAAMVRDGVRISILTAREESTEW